MTSETLTKRVANAIAKENAGTGTWANTLAEARHILAALGLDDLDTAVHRANIDHPHTGLQIGTDCARAVLEAALLTEEQNEMTEPLVGGERRTRAERMYDEHRVSGSPFWRELAPQERALWIIVARERDRAEKAEARVEELMAAALVYFREFDHLVGKTDYPERAALRNALRDEEDQ